MNPAAADLLQHPERVAENPEQELPGLLLQMAGLLTALSSRMPALFRQNEHPEVAVKDNGYLLTIPQVAEILNVPRGYAYELARRGEIPTVRFGKYVRVSLSDLRAWTSQRCKKELDEAMYTTYSHPNSGRHHDRRGTPANPKAARADSGGAGRSARRHLNDRRPMGAQ